MKCTCKREAASCLLSLSTRTRTDCSHRPKGDVAEARPVHQSREHRISRQLCATKSHGLLGSSSRDSLCVYASFDWAGGADRLSKKKKRCTTRRSPVILQKF